ncbi:MAG: GGDEF domain-containing protein [Myxococcales bacterium]|nr:GGDEF domain-containing protein [Myxococcales bacterium]
MARSDGNGADPRRLASTLSPEVTDYLDTEAFAVPSPQAPDGVRGSVVVIAGTAADVGHHVMVEDALVVGRVGAGLILRDGRISRRHARIFRDLDGWFVEDLGSTNGTSLNGRPLTEPAPLETGDKVYLGGTIVKFTLVDETEAAYLERMARLAGTDPLTGLHAKHRFDAMLDDALRTATVTDTSLAVLMMDMDGLKRINDAHGHRMGAHTIGVVGRLIGAVLQGAGEACRFGGDEFCAYVVGDLPAALGLAERIRQEVADRPYVLDEAQVRATISIGVTQREAAASRTALVAAADRALYRAKANGRNVVST